VDPAGQVALQGLRPAPNPTTSGVMKFLQLNFIPRSTDLALLVMRIWFGGSLLWLHGLGKLTGFSSRMEKFPDFFGIGSPATLGLAVFGEVVCSLLLVLGLFTRVAALFSGTTMFVAFWFAHGAKLTGPGNGELAFVYLAAFVTLFIAGGGRHSLDASMGAKR
jgi:putative oxidoreductase